MEAIVVGIIGIVVLIILFFARVHIGISMALVGFLGFAFIVGLEPALGVLKTVPFSTLSSQNLSVIPLFFLMGAFVFTPGISEDLYRTVHKWLGHFRGGLAMATVAACACFAAISGSSLVTAAPSTTQPLLPVPSLLVAISIY